MDSPSLLLAQRAVTINWDEAAREFRLNDTPPSRKVSRPLKLRTASRINSIPTIPVHRQKEEEKPIPDNVTKYSLPTIEVKDTTMAFRRLEAGTLSNLMKNRTQEEFESQFILVDCRYPYEYNGGHIKGAVNLYEQKDCDGFFFGENFNRDRIPIFYCEYSQKRGPTMATLLRSNDRCRNVHSYPKVTFEQIYVLDGGYRGFYNWATKQELETLCTPSAYIEMDDERFTAELRQFTFHRKNYRVTAGRRAGPYKQPSSIRARVPLYKSKSTPTRGSQGDVLEDLPEESPKFVPARLNFSLSSPELDNL